MDKDELRELIATEVQNIIKIVCKAAVNVPSELHELQSAMTPEGIQAREERKREATRITAHILSAVDDYVRETQARVVEKTEPERAKNIRSFKPTY